MATTFSWSQPTNLRNNATPVDPTDAATKGYVDAQVNDPAGPNGAVQFNLSGELGGSGGFTTDGLNVTIGGNLSGSDLTIIDSGNITFNPAGNIILSDDFINGLANPVRAQDAATKSYVDSVAQGLQVKTACQVATDVALPTNTYNNGVSGVGATLTATTNGALTVDGTAVANGFRVLVKNETDAENNGIYVVTSAGGAGSAYVLTRSPDCDQSDEFNGAYTFIQDGDVNSTSSWICSATVANPVTVGTTAVTFIEFSRAGVYTAGPGLTLTGTQFTPDVDGSTVFVNPSNQISIPADAPLTTPVLTGATGDNITLSDTIDAETGIFGNVDVTGTVISDTIVNAGNITSNVVTANGVITDDLIASFIAGPSLTITTTDVNGIITLSPQGSGNISVDGSYITGVNNPVNAQDAATKAYVDNSIAAGYGNANVAAYIPTYNGNIGGSNMIQVAIGQNAGGNITGLRTVSIGQNAGANLQGQNSVAIGGNAGVSSQGNSTVAVGYLAGQTSQGTDAVAIGAVSGVTNQGSSAIAIGQNTGVISQGGGAVAIGSVAGRNTQGGNAIAIGLNAAQVNQGNNSIAIGAGAGSDLNSFQAANSIVFSATGAFPVLNSGFYVSPVRNDNTSVTQSVYYNTTTKELTYSSLGTSSYANANVAAYLPTYTGNIGTSGMSNVNIGNSAGQTSQGVNSIAIGNLAGQTTQGNTSVAIGNRAGTQTQGFDSVAIGNSAGVSFQREQSVAIGAGSGANIQLRGAVAVGWHAGGNSQGVGAVAVGIGAGGTTQGDGAIAVGGSAGQNQQGIGSIGIGSGAGKFQQGANSIALGTESADSGQGQYSVAIGYSASSQNQGNSAISIGTNAGDFNQGINAIAIGNLAGNLNQSTQTIAIGFNAATTGQSANAIAIGSGSGLNTQGANAIAIGTSAAPTNQGANAIAIGSGSGFNLQGANAIAIGTNAGSIGGLGLGPQGANSVALGTDTNANTGAIAIGTLADATLANSIIINATGALLTSANANSFCVSPIRSFTPATLTPTRGLNYNTSTSEIYSSTLAIGSRSNFNSPVGSILQFDNLQIAFPSAIPSPLSITAVSGSFQAAWSGQGITAGNGITINQGNQGGFKNITAGTYTPLVQFNFEQAGDMISVIFANQNASAMYRITGQLQLSGGFAWFGFIERLL